MQLLSLEKRFNVILMQNVTREDIDLYFLYIHDFWFDW